MVLQIPRRNPVVLVGMMIALSAAQQMMIGIAVCSALSAPSNASSKRINNGNNNNNNGIRIEIFDPSVESEASLEALRDCRRLAFAPDKQNWLNTERDFVAARSVVDGKNLCAVALDTTNNNDDESITVVGSADLTPKAKGQNVITNVFVRPDQRGRGIGKLLMVEGIETVLAEALPPNNRSQNETENNNNNTSQTTTTTQTAVLSLDVYTKNTPAITLYQKLGYEPSSAVHAATLALANALGANLVVSMSKTVPIRDK